MSLQSNGVWAGGLWASGVWAENVWYETIWRTIAQVTEETWTDA